MHGNVLKIERTIDILNIVKLLTREQQESYENTKFCCICKEKVEDEHTKDKK